MGKKSGPCTVHVFLSAQACSPLIGLVAHVCPKSKPLRLATRYNLSRTRAKILQLSQFIFSHRNTITYLR